VPGNSLSRIYFGKAIARYTEQLCMLALYSIPLASGFFTTQAVHRNDIGVIVALLKILKQYA
jgi:hypothetical protein